LLSARWPAISIEPREVRGECWSFYLQINASVRKLPFKFAHGIVCSQAGGQPQVMSKELQAALKGVKDQFLEMNFKVNTSNWLAVNEKDYKEYALGDDPQVLTRLLNGILADDVAGLFIELFNKWADKIEHLNSQLFAEEING
jgi:hypothetical protein